VTEPLRRVCTNETDFKFEIDLKIHAFAIRSSTANTEFARNPETQGAKRGEAAPQETVGSERPSSGGAPGVLSPSRFIFRQSVVVETPS
jgi:hypothetical protein